MNQNQAIKEELYKKLLNTRAFWSYNMTDVASVPNEVLIEKIIICLEHEELQILFEVFPKKYIKKVWRERLAIAGNYYKHINYMMAHIYFNIKDPEKYMKTVSTIHVKKITGQYEKTNS